MKRVFLAFVGASCMLAAFAAQLPTSHAQAIPPSIGSVTPTSAIAGSATTVAARFENGSAAVQSCHLFVDGQDVGPMTIIDSEGGGSASRTYVFPSPGIHAAFVQCNDASYTYSSGPTTSVLVAMEADTLAPRVDELGPNTAIVNATTMFTAVVHDDESGVASCGLYANETYIGPMTITGGIAARLYAFPNAGTYPVEVRCTDTAGNQGTLGEVVTVTNASATGVSPTRSTITITPAILPADNATDAIATVTPRNGAGAPIANARVTVLASRGVQDAIAPGETVTDAQGRAQFFIHSATQGIGYYVASSDVQIADAPTITFVSPAAYKTNNAEPGSLMKLHCPDGFTPTDPCRAVYYYGSDGKRHAFPNEKTYFTWYSNFRGVLDVSPAFLASVPLGRNATARPGIRMVKFPSVPKTYVISKGGVLHWIRTEKLAAAIYGGGWRYAVDDVSEAFYHDYTFGTDIVSNRSYNPTTEASLAPTIDQN